MHNTEFYNKKDFFVIIAFMIPNKQIYDTWFKTKLDQYNLSTNREESKCKFSFLGLQV